MRHFGVVNAARWTATLILLLAYAAWAMSRAPFSATATVAVMVPGAAALLLGSFHRRPLRRGDRVRGVGAWIAVAVSAAGWELAAYLQHPRADHPTLSSVANAVLASHSVRTAAFALWLVAAVELGRR